MMDQLFFGASQADRGTLANLKEIFHHRNVKHKVMAAYQHVADFIEVYMHFSFNTLIALDQFKIH
jgi:hypothetical protein